MREKLAIATVVYKNYDILKDFFTSLHAQEDKEFHLFLADASPEKQNISCPFPHTIIPIENHGYAFGINTCIHNAKEQGFIQYCAINDDTYFRPNFVKTVKESIKAKPATLIGGKIYYAPGYEYHKHQYSHEDLGKVLWYAGGVMHWDHATASHIGVDEIDSLMYSMPMPTEFITGCLMCFDDELIARIGYMDTSYFLYYEDTDYCVRAKRTGLSLYYDPNIVIWHKNGQSTDGAGSMLHAKLQKKSHLRFALKYAPLRTKLHVLKNYFFR